MSPGEKQKTKNKPGSRKWSPQILKQSETGSGISGWLGGRGILGTGLGTVEKGHELAARVGPGGG